MAEQPTDAQSIRRRDAEVKRLYPVVYNAINATPGTGLRTLVRELVDNDVRVVDRPKPPLWMGEQ